MRQATFPTMEADVYALHQQIEALMDTRSANHYIWAAEPIGSKMTAITIRADRLPKVLEQHGTEVTTQFSEGDELRFGLVTQCTVRRGAKNNRVPLDTDDDVRRLEWLNRRAALNGFAVVTAEIASVEHIRVKKLGARHVADRTRFEGKLRVTDPTKFAEAMRKGIGHGKAFGLGLIYIH